MASDNSPTTGAGEPSRTLALLWVDASAAPRRRGPGRSVTVEQVVDAALNLADEQGLAAVTMRAVAEAVGVSAMSVYTYVPGKAELLDLMVDTLYRRMPRPAWRRMRRHALSTHAPPCLATIPVAHAPHQGRRGQP